MTERIRTHVKTTRQWQSVLVSRKHLLLVSLLLTISSVVRTRGPELWQNAESLDPAPAASAAATQAPVAGSRTRVVIRSDICKFTILRLEDVSR